MRLKHGNNTSDNPGPGAADGLLILVLWCRHRNHGALVSEMPQTLFDSIFTMILPSIGNILAASAKIWPLSCSYRGRCV